MAFKDLLGIFNGDILNNLIGTGYTIYQDQRNYKYQENLQRELWNRDDTAIQRRMADLEAAGINPLLAGTSGASNTSAGGPSGQNIIPPQQSISQIQIDRERAKQEKNKTDYEENMYNFNLDIAKLQQNILTLQRDQYLTDFFNALGIPYYAKTIDEGNKTGWYFEAQPGLTINPENMPKQKMFNNQVSISDIQRAIASTDYSRSLNDLLISNKNLNWYTADKILDYANGVTGIYKNIMAPFNWSWNNSHSFGNYTSQSNNTSTNYNYNFNKRY